MLVSLGEALIDRIHPPGGGAAAVHVGGSPFNVAIALARLGVRAGLICPLSRDVYGQMLLTALESEGVRPLVKERAQAPTATADVYADESGVPRYVFQREGTADRALDAHPPVSALPSNCEALHFGSLTLAQARDWPAWRAAVAEARRRGAFIALDINVRPPLIDEMSSYLGRVEEAIELSSWVKASDEDVLGLWPNKDPEDVVRAWASNSKVSILTRGSEGAWLFTATGVTVQVSDPLEQSDIQDTVGAGDTFHAACLAWLHHHGALGDPISEFQGRELLRFACKAARMNCERQGCDPPTLEEL